MRTFAEPNSSFGFLKRNSRKKKLKTEKELIKIFFFLRNVGVERMRKEGVS